MNEHLPECPSKSIVCEGEYCYCDYAHFCCCDELRACEVRATAAAVQRVEALNFWEEHVREFVHRDEAIAAIKGDQP